MADVATINSLPPEILTGIFSHLPLVDRKSTRLVCKEWYICCTRVKILRNDKFVFRTGLFSYEGAVNMMLNPNFPILNLEFQGRTVKNNLPGSDIWSMCGSRIRTLTFYNAQWDDDTIRNIIIHCTNLTSITITMCNHKFGMDSESYNLDSISRLPGLLDELVRSGIRHTALLTFNIFINDVLLPDSILSKIILIYPNLRHFSTGFSKCFRRDHGGWRIQDFPGAIPRPDNYLNSISTTLEQFTFNIPTDGSWLKNFVAEGNLKLSLKHFETKLVYDDDSMKKTLLKFFSTQKTLNVVKLDLERTNLRHGSLQHQADLYEITLHILHSCPNLNELHLSFTRFPSYVEWTARPQFIASISKLNVLTMEFRRLCNENIFENLPEVSDFFPQKDLALTQLRLQQYYLNEELCIAFLQHCPELKHLHLALKCTDRILQTIFKHLVKLETLILTKIDSCTDYGFIGNFGEFYTEEGYSIKQLQQLKYLKIGGYGPTRLTEKFVGELQLPQLQFFSLQYKKLYKKISIEMLVHLASLVPRLEVLGINLVTDCIFDDNFSVIEKTIVFCQQFKCLNHLISDRGSQIELAQDEYPEIFESIFKTCPSLRYISNGISLLQFNSTTNKTYREDIKNFTFKNDAYFLE